MIYPDLIETFLEFNRGNFMRKSLELSMPYIKINGIRINRKKTRAKSFKFTTQISRNNSISSQKRSNSLLIKKAILNSASSYDSDVKSIKK